VKRIHTLVDKPVPNRRCTKNGGQNVRIRSIRERKT